MGHPLILTERARCGWLPSRLLDPSHMFESVANQPHALVALEVYACHNGIGIAERLGSRRFQKGPQSAI